MPQIRQRRERKRYVFAVASVSAAFLLLVGGLLVYYGTQRLQSEQEFDRLTTLTKLMATEKHAQQAAELWVKYAKDSSNEQKLRAKAWQNAGANYMTAADYSDAQTSFQNSLNYVKLNYTISTEIAQAAQLAGHKDVALKYYKEALNRIPKDMYGGDKQKQFFNTQISQLEQSQ